jgi:hypothetical protein
MVPTGTPPSGGWPLAIVGHGWGGEMFVSAMLLAGTLARHGLATAAISVVGHGGGPRGRLLVTGTNGARLAVQVPGRGLDADGDGQIARTEGLAARGAARALGISDGVRQQVVDLMALARALRDGLDVDGDGLSDIDGRRLAYVGQSLGGIYGALLLAVDPRVRLGVLNVPGGSVIEIARLAPSFRPLLERAMGERRPPLTNRPPSFQEDLPLRGDPAVTGPVSGALAIQAFLARAEWLSRRGDPLAYARHLRSVPLAEAPARLVIQFAQGDRVVPNPTTEALVRAGELWDSTVRLRWDRVAEQVPGPFREPHGFLLRVGAPGLVGTTARAAQEQVARFLASAGVVLWMPDDDALVTPAGPLFEPFAAHPRR